MLAIFVTLAATACFGGLGAIASPEPPDAYHWRATPGGEVSLAPVLDAGDAGWCMQTVTLIVTANSITSSRACPAPPTSTGPIFAEECNDSREEGACVFLLTRDDVASVSIAGGTPIPTTTHATLPNGLRAASLQAPEYPFKLSSPMHCPEVTPFAANGEAIPTQSKPGVPLASRLPYATWRTLSASHRAYAGSTQPGCAWEP
jgi:hypothetical protein